jgi:hypothetical protein
LKKLRLLVAVVGLALATVAAHAQFGIYVNPIAIRVSNSTADSGPFAFLGQNSKSQMFYGLNLGSYYNLLQQAKTEAGIDIRDSIVHGNSASLNSFLVGARLAVSPFHRPIKPYLQASIGAGTSRAATNPVHITKAQYGVYVGADYPLNHHVDLRVLEVGYSSLITASSATIGGTATIPASNLLSFSTGVVLRFP